MRITWLLSYQTVLAESFENAAYEWRKKKKHNMLLRYSLKCTLSEIEQKNMPHLARNYGWKNMM